MDPPEPLTVRRRSRVWLLVVVAGVVLVTVGAGAAFTASMVRGGDGAAAPACGSVSRLLVPSCGAWWGVYTRADRGAAREAPVERLESAVGRRFDVVMQYHDFSTGASGPFPDEAERRLAQHRILLVSWQSRRYADDSDLRWSDVAAGRYDADVIVPTARRVRDLGLRIFVAFDPEMDRLTGKKGTPEQYVAAARHVRAVFDQERVRNVVWVWTTTGYLGDGNAQIIERSYPGDDVVDWVGYDPYNFFRCKDAPWETFEESMAGTYDWLQQRAYRDKPVMLAEYGTQYDPQDPQRSRQWYLDIPPTLRDRPAVKAVVRWDSDFGCGLGIDSGPGMLQAFATAGRDPYLSQPLPASVLRGG